MAEAATSKAISEITKQAVFLYGVDEQVKELVTELGRMRAFLKDVDSRKQTKERIKNWADEIRNLAQDAEGIVDKFAAKVKQRRGEDTACGFCTLLVNVVKEVVVRYRIGWGISKINKRIKNFRESLKTYGIDLGATEVETSFREVILQSGSIYVESWGGRAGGLWSYRPKGLVKDIIVKHGEVIDSITFKSIEENGVMETSQRFGGVKGHLTTEINIDSPSEYLTGISGTFGDYHSDTIIKSIMFHTNRKLHGPIGSVKGRSDTNFSFIMKEGGVIVGLHGFSGFFIGSIGVYVMPHNSLLS